VGPLAPARPELPLEADKPELPLVAATPEEPLDADVPAEPEAADKTEAPLVPAEPLVPEVPEVPDVPYAPVNSTVQELNVPEPFDSKGVTTISPVLGLYDTTLPIIELSGIVFYIYFNIQILS
jgi:hypothetical protein